MAVEISVGAVVTTSDGKELGKVKESGDSAFLVAAPRAFDYWLDKHLVQEANAERVALTIANADIGSYKMDQPHDHNEFQAEVPDKLHPRNVRDSMMHGGNR